jgi:hypothetical protein
MVQPDKPNPPSIQLVRRHAELAQRHVPEASWRDLQVTYNEKPMTKIALGFDFAGTPGPASGIAGNLATYFVDHDCLGREAGAR